MAQDSSLENDLLVEFFYLDKLRLASFAGQLSDKGVPTSLKSLAAKTHKITGEASAGIPAIAAGKSGLDRTTAESVEQTYDPFWTHAYTFLRELEREYAEPLPTARMGSLVKFKALVQLLDLRLLRNVWEPAAMIHAGQQDDLRNTQPSTRQGRRDQRRAQRIDPTAELALKVLKEIPHSVHMSFMTADGIRLWSAIQPTNLTLGSEDLMMKHGVAIDGLWTVVGIVDANVGEQPATLPLNDLLNGVVTAMNQLRALIGRPFDHFGLTPIAIYKPLGGVIEDSVSE